jgi:uncharacterized protein
MSSEDEPSTQGAPLPDGEAGSDAVLIVDNPAERRFEARVEERVVGYAEYRPAGNRLIFTHTVVDPSMEGRGIGSRLAAGALDAVRARGMRATVHCPFITGWLRRHPEYEDILAGG